MSLEWKKKESVRKYSTTIRAEDQESGGHKTLRERNRQQPIPRRVEEETKCLWEDALLDGREVKATVYFDMEETG